MGLLPSVTQDTAKDGTFRHLPPLGLTECLKFFEAAPPDMLGQPGRLTRVQHIQGEGIMRRYASALFTAVAVAACGGGPTGVNEGDPLELEEIQALFDELSAAFVQAGVGPTQSRRYDLPEMQVLTSSVPIDASIDISVPCTGGTITLDGSVDGDIDDETFEGDMSMEFTWGINDCDVTTETTTFTVTGEIAFEGDFTFTESLVTMSGREQGGISFTADDGRSGSCAFDVSFEASISDTSGSYEVTGQVCGRDVSDLEPFGFAT